MKKDIEKLIDGLKYWKINIENPSYDKNYQSRLILQKLTYLCKSLGMEMDYRFNLYKNGPYCPSLTNDYYEYSNEIVSLKTDFNPLKSDKVIYDKIRKFVLSHQLFNEHKADLLEAVSTVQFLKQLNPGEMDDLIFEKSKNEKPNLSDRLITIAINISKELNFKPEFLTKELKEELELWENAED